MLRPTSAAFGALLVVAELAGAAAALWGADARAAAPRAGWPASPALRV